MLTVPPCGRDAGVLSDGLPDASGAIAPFQVICALRMALLLAVNTDVVRCDTAVSRYNYGTESPTLRCFDAFGEVDFPVHLMATFRFSVSPKVSWPVKQNKTKELAERGGFEPPIQLLTV